ncbi:MAG: TIGR00725 family protein [Methylocystis sp.]|uniref:TIGR00725 family protein n=1 Tax=Methylocystis sp. TaxID=1911079 RepID=UPI003D13A9AB
MAQSILGIMGPGEKATADNLEWAYEIGKLAARAGYVVLTGARRSGVMEAGLRGAKDAGGQTIGILPSKSKSDASPFADLVVVTGLNSARNYINALTADVMVVCGVEAGTLSEIALALKEQKHVVLITENERASAFLKDLSKEFVHVAAAPEEAMAIVNALLKNAAPN